MPLDLEQLEEHVRSMLHETRTTWKVGPIVSIQAPGDAPVEAVLALIGMLGNCGAVGFEFASYGGQLPSKHRSTIPLGRRGAPNKLGVSGEELPKVAYSLLDASSYQGRKIVVVGADTKLPCCGLLVGRSLFGWL